LSFPAIAGATLYLVNIVPPLDFAPDGIWANPGITALPGNGFTISPSGGANSVFIAFQNPPNVTGIGNIDMELYYYTNAI
jgi:hypothetical protein